MEGYRMERATMEQVGEVFDIYRSLTGSPGCTWNDKYPTLEDVEKDVRGESLYILYDGCTVIAAACIEPADEFEHLPFWDPSLKHPCNLARAGVRKEYQNRGIAKELIRRMEKDAVKRGFDGIRLLVGKQNLRAEAVYKASGFHWCGETSMFDQEWNCYEKKIGPAPV